MSIEKVASILQQNGEETQHQYDKWKEKIEEIVERNTSTMKRKNPRKCIRELIKKKKELKKQSAKCSHKGRESMIQRIRIVNEQIAKERKSQFKNKIDKVVHKLKCKRGINGPNMWEVLKSIKGRRAQPATAIKSKEGVVLENPEEIKERLDI